jgi:hypothetical protein
MTTENLRKPLPATGTIFTTWVYFAFDEPVAVAEAERLLRSRGYNTEVQGTFVEQANWECTPVLVWRASPDCFAMCRSTGMLRKSLNEVARIIEPLGGDIPVGADLFDVSWIRDPANWQKEVDPLGPVSNRNFRIRRETDALH